MSLSSGASKVVSLTLFSLLRDSIKSSWNISVVKFLLEKLKQELMVSPHNYTDKELKGKDADPLCFGFCLPLLLPVLGREGGSMGMI